VPLEVELGYHLCYGSPADEHLLKPHDTRVLVDMMHGIAAATPRAVCFFHIPVPKERTDEAYYEPLGAWRPNAATELYLGLLHYDDEAGNRKRVAVARKFIDDFGLSAECGWGRTEPGRLPGLLKGHRAAAEAF
jgi:hypothetical protein